MIRAAMEFIKELTPGMPVELRGEQYATKKVELPPPEPVYRPDPIFVQSITGLIDYIDEEIDGKDNENLFIHVEQPDVVRLYSYIDAYDQKRSEIVTAKYRQPKLPVGEFYDHEDFIINLMSCFVQNPDLEHLLMVCGSLTADKIRTSHDDGVSQTVSVKSGVHLKGDVNVKSRVNLKPFRTFNEIDQPESLFLFRVHQKSEGFMPEPGLFAADGNAWRLKAMKDIKTYLFEHLTRSVSILA